MMSDVLVVGAGPAGSIAALVLARAGVNVTVVDRATFPRDKLCGDSVNPGAMALLERLGLAAAVRERALPVRGMLLTGPGGAAVDARYPRGVAGCSIRRRDLDALLLEASSRAGARLEERTRVVAPIVNRQHGADRVAGVRLRGPSRESDCAARVVIAADGRRSTLAFALGLARHPVRPRRWALGAYFEGVAGPGDYGEMHVRRGHYVGVAPVPDGLVNLCLVVPEARARQIGGAGAAALEQTAAGDPLLRDRFARARRVTPVATLGPLAVDVNGAGVDGLLLAGDAAGFVDAITGDGIHLAMRSGTLAADAALAALAGCGDAHRRLQRRRAAAFGRKLLLNKTLRQVVDIPSAIGAAALVTRAHPRLLAPLVYYAGDVGLATRPRPEV